MRTAPGSYRRCTVALSVSSFAGKDMPSVNSDFLVKRFEWSLVASCFLFTAFKLLMLYHHFLTMKTFATDVPIDQLVTLESMLQHNTRDLWQIINQSFSLAWVEARHRITAQTLSRPGINASSEMGQPVLLPIIAGLFVFLSCVNGRNVIFSKPVTGLFAVYASLYDSFLLFTVGLYCLWMAV